jgi:IS4 transposase
LTSKKYSKPLRLIGYFDAETGVTYEFLTNNFKLAALSIAKIYKARWHVELFFKWIKQHLRIKTFLGTSKNAVLTQVWAAMSYFLLHRLVQNTLLDRLSLIDLLRLPEKKLPALHNAEPQLCLAL